MRVLKMKFRLFVVVSAFLLVACQSYGTIVYWQGPDGGDYTTPANWSDGQAPSNNGYDQVISTANHAVISSSAVGAYVEIGGNSSGSGDPGYLDIIAGASFQVDNSLYLAFGGTGTLTMSGGTANVDAYTYIGRTPDKTGTLTMTGGHWTTGLAMMAIPEDSTGELVLGGDAIFEVTSAHFYFDNWSNNGMLGTATIEINDNAQLIIRDPAGFTGWRYLELEHAISIGQVFTTDAGKVPNISIGSSGWLTLTSVPEPATIALLASGMLILRRNRRK